MLKEKGFTSFDKGKLGILHLPRMWERMISEVKKVKQDSNKSEWKLDLIIVDGLGLGIEETLKYLLQYAPSYQEFEKWILDKNGGKLSSEKVKTVNNAIKAELEDNNSSISGVSLRDEEKKVLTEDDLMFWEKNGYVIIKNAVPEENVRAALDAIWNFLDMTPDDPESWYKHHPSRQGIMVQFFQNEALEANRQSKRIQGAFAQLWGTDNLIISTDRVSLNPPEREDWRFPGPNLHWDTSLKLPIPFNLQGLLYLTDTKADQGAFTCVPGFHKKIGDWLNSLPAGKNPREQNLESLGALPIEAKAGDFIIWHHSLPHGSKPNTADFPRIVQYIKLYPPDYEDNREWI